MPRSKALHAALMAATLLTACGSSGSTASSSDPTSTTAASSGGGSGSAPAVTHATDLKTAPVIAAGTPPPPTTLVIKDLVVGTGTEAVASSTVKVHYVGANYANGEPFDSSWDSGQPVDFPLNSVIPGFSQGIVGMKVGGRRELVIPPDLGYGAQGSPPAVGPNETLVFVIDLVGVQ